MGLNLCTISLKYAIQCVVLHFFLSLGASLMEFINILYFSSVVSMSFPF
jgi:hypothetical protein